MIRGIPRSVVLVGALTGIAHAQCAFQALQASDGQTLDLFGAVVALDGDRAIIAARQDKDLGNDSGSAYVFERQAGVWSEVQELHASDAMDDDSFGLCVDIDGDWAAVSSLQSQGGAKGAVYLFERQGGAWNEVAKLTPSDATALDIFGVSLDLEGARIVVGSTEDQKGLLAGGVYVFEKVGSTWVETDKLLATDGEEGDRFGCGDVSLWGDTVLVGAEEDDDGGHRAGAAYVFERVGGAWVETVKLSASDAAVNAFFGVDVALWEDTALIGAPRGGDHGPVSGAAYVFERQGASWVEVEKISGPGAFLADNFGGQLDLAGGVAVIGAEMADDKGMQSGAAYVYRRTNLGWLQTAKLIDPDGEMYHFFGSGVAVGGSTVLVGSLGDGPQTDSGFVHAYSLEDCDLGWPSCFGYDCPGSPDLDGGCPNSTGVGARLTGSGSTSVAADDLLLRATEVPPTQPGLFFMGDLTVAEPLSAGLRCAGGTVVRFRSSLQDSGLAGELSHTGFAGESAGAIAPGTTWHFQAWYRDPANGQGGTNLTHLYSVTFVP